MALFLGVAIRQAARPMLFSLARIGLSANFAESAVKKAFGSAWRRQDFLMDYRKIGATLKTVSLPTRALSRGLYPTDNMVNVALSRPRRYYIMGKASVLDRTTGEVTERYVSSYDNTRRSENAWINDLSAVVEGDAYQKNLQVQSMEMFAPQHNWDMEF